MLPESVDVTVVGGGTGLDAATSYFGSIDSPRIRWLVPGGSTAAFRICPDHAHRTNLALAQTRSII